MNLFRQLLIPCDVAAYADKLWTAEVARRNDRPAPNLGRALHSKPTQLFDPIPIQQRPMLVIHKAPALGGDQRFVRDHWATRSTPRRSLACHCSGVDATTAWRAARDCRSPLRRRVRSGSQPDHSNGRFGHPNVQLLQIQKGHVLIAPYVESGVEREAERQIRIRLPYDRDRAAHPPFTFYRCALQSRVFGCRLT